MNTLLLLLLLNLESTAWNQDWLDCLGWACIERSHLPNEREQNILAQHLWLVPRLTLRALKFWFIISLYI